MPKAISIDTEWAPDGKLLTAGFATPTQAKAYDREVLGVGVPSYLLRNAKWLMGHSVFGDIDKLFHTGLIKEEWVSGKKVLDSLLLARMIDENRSAYDLESLLCSGHQVEPWKYRTELYSEIDATKWPPELRQDRCRLDAWASAVLCHEAAHQVPSALRTFTHQVAAVIHRIHLAGAYVDSAAFSKMGQDLKTELTRLNTLLSGAAKKAGMNEFSPTKDRDLRELLYKRLRLHCEVRTKKGALAVNKLALKQHADHPVVKLITEYNVLEKRFSTWYGNENRKTEKKTLRELISQIDANTGFLRFNINPLGARTGRRSSSAPNSQNWPKKVRGIIKSRWPHGQIGDFDYSRLEVVLMGWAAQEEQLLEYFGKGGPGYIGIAKDLFHKNIKKDSDDYRIQKAIVLGVQFGMGPYKLAYQLWWDLGIKLSSDWGEHVNQATELRDKYLRRFPGIKRYMAQRRRELLATGQVVSATNRVRHLPCPAGENTEGFGHLLNEAINFPIQSLAADITGSALIDVEAALCQEYGLSLLEYHQALLGSKYPVMPLLINEVHDDLVFDLPHNRNHKRDIKLIEEVMQAVPTLRKLVPDFDIPLSVGINLAPRWGVVEE